MKNPLHLIRAGLLTLRGSWRSLPHLTRHILINLIIGLAIAMAIHLMHDFPMIANQQEEGFDYLLRMTAGTEVAEDTIPTVILDIDSVTYRKWGEPLATPRDRLAKLVHFAVEGGAVSIIVDIDQSRIDNGRPDPLADYLASLYGDDDHPHIVLVKTFQESLRDEQQDYRQQRSTHLDAVVAGSKRLHWASPLFDLDPDNRIRRWRLWEASCTPKGAPSYLPSVQLLSLAIHRSGSADGLQQQLDQALPQDCRHWESFDKQLEVVLEGVKFTTTASHLQQRIIYNFPWPEIDPYDPPKVRFQYQGRSIDTPVLQWIPAHLVTEATTPPDSLLIAGRDVVIGASFADSRDLHATPLGFMPGALILVNAIHSLLDHGQLQPPPAWLLLLIEAFLIILMSLLFTYYSPVTATYLTIFGVVLVIFPASLLLFKEGVWVDLAVPLVGVHVHELVGVAEVYWREKKQRCNLEPL